MLQLKIIKLLNVNMFVYAGQTRLIFSCVVHENINSEVFKLSLNKYKDILMSTFFICCMSNVKIKIFSWRKINLYFYIAKYSTNFSPAMRLKEVDG